VHYPTPPDPDFLAHVAERKAALRTQLAALCPPGKPLTWEIGCGHGHFLVRYAASRPDELCIGIDLIRERIVRSEKKRDRARLAHLHFIKCEAAEFLDCLPAETRLGSILVLFPDPWPKRRHHKNRLFQDSFLTTLAAKAGQGSRLYLRTDHADYFKAARETIAAHAAWKIDPDAPWPLEEPTVFQQKAPSYQSLAALKTDSATPAGKSA